MGKLFIVPTPIGNLKDFTFRAVEVLNEVDCILAEDTRKSIILLNHYKIKARLIGYHAHNEHAITPKIIENIKLGKTYAIISDAGTPSISDPGFLLVRECIKNDIEITSLPGPSSITTALTLSGLPSDRFVFEGFLPKKKGRQTRLKELATEKRTIIFFESPYRLLKTLEDLKQHFGENKKAAVCREMSKLYEEIKRGNIISLIKYFNNCSIKGEIVIIVGI